jgi:pyrroloquinoline-quinone synthase
MTSQKMLDFVCEKYNLLRNPFYQAWSMGTLPVTALQTYASEYGNFLASLPVAWETLADHETAHEEKEHADMWALFTNSINAPVTSAGVKETKELIALVQDLFAKPASAIGALYAFEVQQPKTAQSKLLGLRTHYPQLCADEKYFEVHSHNEHEAAKLLARFEALSPEDQQVAIEACELTSRTIWKTLEAFYPQSK